MQWEGAKCQGLDPDIFFPENKGNGRYPPNYIPDPNNPRTREEAEFQVARQICRGGDGEGECPIRQQCLDHALANPSLEGVWGGYTEEGRRKLRKKLRRQRAA